VNARSIAIVTLKIIVTGLCFWYLAGKINFVDAVRAAQIVDFEWATVAALLLVLQIPLGAVRWSLIIAALEDQHNPVRRGPIFAITAIAGFFSQLMPNIASEGIRVWMLTRVGANWRNAFASVIIDRAIGLGTFIAAGLALISFPSTLVASVEHRLVLVAIFAVSLVVGLTGLLLAPRIARILEHWHGTAWVGRLAHVTHYVMLRTSAGIFATGITLALELLTIISLWVLGNSFGMPLRLLDAGVLFTIIFCATLLPISIAGWGIRELAVTTLLGRYGVPLEQSLMFSVGFGLALLVATFPGALLWIIYSAQKDIGQLHGCEGQQ
jgi:glycosyltransferase 2 family protein